MSEWPIVLLLVVGSELSVRNHSRVTALQWPNDRLIGEHMLFHLDAYFGRSLGQEWLNEPDVRMSVFVYHF